VTGASVRAEELVGQVDGRPVIVVDDKISTGATIEAAVRLLLENGARSDVVVVATHGLFVRKAVERLAGLPLRRLIVTDSLAGIESLALPVEVPPPTAHPRRPMRGAGYLTVPPAALLFGGEKKEDSTTAAAVKIPVLDGFQGRGRFVSGSVTRSRPS
jgi:hypothetical protein